MRSCQRLELLVRLVQPVNQYLHELLIEQHPAIWGCLTKFHSRYFHHHAFRGGGHRCRPRAFLPGHVRHFTKTVPYREHSELMVTSRNLDESTDDNKR